MRCVSFRRGKERDGWLESETGKAQASVRRIITDSLVVTHTPGLLYSGQ